MKIYNRERLGMWKLKPCPCCNGDSRIQTTDDQLHAYAVCLECGLRTPYHVAPEQARKVWDRRCTEHAQVLTLDKLFESTYLYTDKNGDAAAWLEVKDKPEITAVIIGVGTNHFAAWEIYLHEVNYDGMKEVPPQKVEKYGITWRVWDKRPTEHDRRNTPWET